MFNIGQQQSNTQPHSNFTPNSDHSSSQPLSCATRSVQLNTQKRHVSSANGVDHTIFTTPVPLSSTLLSPDDGSIMIHSQQEPTTAGGGDCAWHAIFGVRINNEFICTDVAAKRQAFVAWLKNGEEQPPGTDALIIECIRDLIAEELLPNGFVPECYKDIMAARQQQGKYVEISEKILAEYYRWIAGEGHWMLRGEIALIAHAFNKTIICYTAGQEPQPYNPGHGEPIIIHFNGVHYERKAHLPINSQPRANKAHSTPLQLLSAPPIENLVNTTNVVSPIVRLKLHNKAKDMRVLYHMLCALIAWEKNPQSAVDTLKIITSFAGGEDGITFKEDDPKCIRNRYGREDKNPDKAGFIDFELLHRAFIILNSKIAITEDITDTFHILKAKILFILHSELQQHPIELSPLLTDEAIALLKDMPSTGDEQNLETIYQYVRKNYYHVAIMCIKAEEAVFKEAMKSRDDLYRVARIIVFIGELCHEIEKDLRKADDKSKATLQSLIDIFIELNRFRNRFVHPRANFFKNFEESSANRAQFNTELGIQINALYEVLENPKIAIDQITQACIAIARSVHSSSRQKKAMSKNGTAYKVDFNVLEEKLRESDEYLSLWSICRSQNNQHLSVTEQEKLAPGYEPSVVEVLTLADRLNAPIVKINALKMLQARERFQAQIEADDSFKALFEDITTDIPEFDIVEKDKCEAALKKMAEFEEKSEHTLKFDKYSDIFGQLKKLYDAYTKAENNQAFIHQFKAHHKKMMEAQVDSSLPEKTKKSQRKQYAKYQKDYADLAADIRKLDQEQFGILTDFDPQTFIDSSDKILAILDYIAPVTAKSPWQLNLEPLLQLVALREGPTTDPKVLKERTGKIRSFFGLMDSAYMAHSIRDPKVLAARVRKESVDNTAYLLEAIHQEMRNIFTVDDRVTDPVKRQAIKEYGVLLVGQYMRDLSEIGALKEILISHTAYEAGSRMQQMRSKGLAHETLRFDPIQFAETFRNIILPAVADFHAVHIVNQYSNSPSRKIQSLRTTAEAYVRLCFYDEAIKLLQEALHIAQTDKKAIDHEKLEEMGLLTENTLVIDGAELHFGIESYAFELRSDLAYAYYQQGNFYKAYEIARDLIDEIEDINFADDEFLNRLADLYSIMANYFLQQQNFTDAVEHLGEAYNLAKNKKKKNHLIYSLQYCQQEARRYEHHVDIPENLTLEEADISPYNRFFRELSRYYQSVEAADFASAKDMLTQLRDFLQTHTGDLRKELGDQYQLCDLRILRAEIVYCVETNTIAERLLDFKQALKAKVAQLPQPLKRDRDIGITLAYLSRAYARVAEKEGDFSDAMALFTNSRQYLEEATKILPETDSELIKAIPSLITCYYNHQLNYLLNDFTASLMMLNEALGLIDRYGLEESPNIFTALGYTYLKQAEQVRQSGNYPGAMSFYKQAYPILNQARVLFEFKHTQGNITATEKFNYREVIRGLGDYYEGYGSYYFALKENGPSKDALTKAIQFYELYLSLPDIDTFYATKISSFKEECLSLIRVIDRRTPQTAKKTESIRDPSTDLNSEEIEMRTLLLNNFNKAQKEKKKKIFFKKLKDAEKFKTFLINKLSIQAAEIHVVSSTYIELKLSADSINLLSELNKQLKSSQTKK